MNEKYLEAIEYYNEVNFPDLTLCAWKECKNKVGINQLFCFKHSFVFPFIISKNTFLLLLNRIR
jgi:hypothetical protein